MFSEQLFNTKNFHGTYVGAFTNASTFLSMRIIRKNNYYNPLSWKFLLELFIFIKQKQTLKVCDR